jgi:3-hydroxyisobutyrate dehydrogenase-like beta-hydroxyacid dehydrogenase
MTNVGWIGLGAMGSRMVARLVEAGHQVTVWNRTRERADDLAGVRVAATSADAVAGADVVALMVTDAEALAEVVNGIAAELKPGTVLIDFSTVGPAAVTALASHLPPGVAVLDAPVLGSIGEAEAGTLKLLVGGSDQVVERCRSLLSALGTVMHVGPQGSGAAAKLVANLALLGSVTLLGETLALADRLGIHREAAWSVLDTTPLAAQAQRRRPVIDADSYPPRFSLRLAQKDAALISTAGAAPPISAAVATWLTEAAAAGLGDLDYTAVLSHILATNGRA